MVRIIIDRICPSVNSAYYFIRIGKRTIKAKTAKAKEFFEYVKRIMSSQQYTTFTCPVEVKLIFTFGTKSRHDLDNYQKLTNDSLRGILWLDDSQIQKITSIKRYEHGKSETIIEVSKYEPTEMDKKADKVESI